MHKNKLSILFEYAPTTNTLSHIGSLSAHVNNIFWVSSDRSKIAATRDDGIWEIGLTTSSEELFSHGKLCDIENNYAVINTRNTCGCLELTEKDPDHNLIFQLPGKALGVKSSHIYIQNNNLDESTIDVWSIAQKALVKRIDLDACLKRSNTIDITRNAKILFSHIVADDRTYTGYVLDPVNGSYSESCSQRNVNGSITWSNVNAGPYKKWLCRFKERKLWHDGEQLDFMPPQDTEFIEISEDGRTILIRKKFEKGFYIYRLELDPAIADILEKPFAKSQAIDAT